MPHIPTMPSDFLRLVVMLCRHLPERQLEATINYHLYGPGWTGGANDLEDQLLRNTLHAAYETHLQHDQLPRPARQPRRDRGR